MSEIGKDAARAWDAIKGVGSDAFKALDDTYAKTKAEMLAPAQPRPVAAQKVVEEPNPVVTLVTAALILGAMVAAYVLWLRPKRDPEREAARRVLRRSGGDDVL